MATIAVFVALGGSSFAEPVRDAASRLITGKQIKDGSLGTKDLSKSARKALKGAAGPAGPAGPQGPRGETGGVDSSNFYNKADSDSRFTNSDEKAFDSDLLDGKDSTEFLGATAKAADADKLDGRDSADFKVNCPQNFGFITSPTVYVGGVCIMTATEGFAATWANATQDCFNFYSKGRLPTYNELITAAKKGLLTLSVGEWTGDSAGDNSAIYINSTDPNDADGVSPRSTSQPRKRCVTMPVNALGLP